MGRRERKARGAASQPPAASGHLSLTSPGGIDALCEAVRAAYPAGPDAVIAVVRAAFLSLTSDVASLCAEVAALRHRLALDSRTSSKAPSTDLAGGLGQR